jgi:CTP synthase (UTP-ammonia lyase)
MSAKSTNIKIALVGDQSDSVAAHAAIPRALALAAVPMGIAVEPFWIPTPPLRYGTRELLTGFDAVWCVPGSPYQDMDGVLNAIRFAREKKIPFLGTCGGSQHALIEFSRNVLGLLHADHAESNPNAELPLIAALPCALRETDGLITIQPNSRAHAIYGRAEITEPFNCGFGLNLKHHNLFQNAALKITGHGTDGIARILELDDHPFFIATLFQPERSALKNTSHPLISAFLESAAKTSSSAGPASRILHSAVK